MHITSSTLVTALCIVGNKTDLQDRIKVSTEEGQKLANSLNAAFVESSAKQNIGKISKLCKAYVITKYLQV